jgi:hypothetical protein
LKNKGLIITTIIFFLLINTTYYWEGKLGVLAFPGFLLLAIIYIGLAIALLRQLYFSVKERFKIRYRNVTIGLLTLVLVLTFLKPAGLIGFDKFEGINLLVAEREGAANCFTTLKLKDNMTFRERIGCFGVSETKGTYKFVNDTIFFDNVKFSRANNEFYKFAIIRPSKFDNNKIIADLILYKDLKDTTGYELWITKNELQKLKSKS